MITAYFENQSTGGSIDIKLNNRSESAARAEALKFETKHRKLVRIEPTVRIKVKRIETAAARQKRLINMMHKLRDEFGGHKYNQVNDNLVIRIAEHCKNPKNDGIFNYDSTVISFFIDVWGQPFKGQDSEFDITEMSFTEAKKFIQSKIK
jgi:hypothetical protein